MFTFRDDQLGMMRRRKLGDRLIKEFKIAGQESRWDQAEQQHVELLDHNKAVTKIGFDKSGFVASVDGPLGRSYKFTNNSVGKPTKAITPTGLEVDLSYDSKDRLTGIKRNRTEFLKFEFDPHFGDVSRIEFSDQSSAAFHYDGTGRLTSTTSRMGTVNRLAYTNQGSVSELTDGLGRTTRFDYSDHEVPERILFANGREEVRRLSPDGQILGRKICGVGIEHIDYDENGNFKKVVYTDGEVVSSKYSPEGRLTFIESPDSKVEFAYDDAGRPLVETCNGTVVKYHYDSVGQLNGITYPDSGKVEFTRDDEQRVIGVKDWAGGVHSLTYFDNDSGYEHRLPNGLSETVEKDVHGQPVLVRVDSRNSSLFSWQTKFDVDSNLIQCADSEYGSRAFQYDSDGQVLAVTSDRRELCESFAYDAAGNRIFVSGNRAVVDHGDQLISQGSVGCEYDVRGNTTSISDRTQWRFDWNARGCLVKATSRDGKTITFGYDGLGRRVWKRAGNVETRYVWALEWLVQEYDVVQTTLSRQVQYLYWPFTYTPIAMKTKEGIFSYHNDHLGTPLRVTDENGHVVWSACYGVFGESILVANTFQQPLRAPGQYLDVETGLHYNRFRYYAPKLGRYISIDPALFLGGVNLYRYAGNNPFTSADPLGLWTLDGVLSVVGKGCGIVAGVAAGVAIGLALPGPAGIILGGMVAGAIINGSFYLMDHTAGDFCWPCFGKSLLSGAVVGGLAAVPFAFLPASAGVAVFMGAGAVAGAIGYTGSWLLDSPPGTPWSWGDFGKSVAIGAGTAGLGRWLGPKLAGVLGPKKGVVVRGDDNPYSPQGSKPGRIKSHVDENGNIVPANPDGDATIQQHVRGAEPKKSDSPYTSFKEGDGTAGKDYGNGTIEVDTKQLKKDIANGKVKDVEVIDNEQLLKEHDRSISEAQNKYNENPTPKNKERLERSQMDRENSARDKEVLIKGVVPKDYVKVNPSGAPPVPPTFIPANPDSDKKNE